MTDATRFTSGTSALRIAEVPRLEVFEGGRVEARLGAPANPEGRPFHLGVTILAVILAVAVTYSAWMFDRSVEASARAAIDAAPHTVVCVHEGDTLWSIAVRNGSDEVGTQRVVSWIREANGLESPLLVVGERLVIPVLGQ